MLMVLWISVLENRATVVCGGEDRAILGDIETKGLDLVTRRSQGCVPDSVWVSYPA